MVTSMIRRQLRDARMMVNLDLLSEDCGNPRPPADATLSNPAY
jgi:hypothetical protein